MTLATTPQPKSVCLAAQPDSDFPAIIIYNAIFDVYLNDQLVLANQTGLGIGTGISEIPPRGVDVAFQKAFDFGELSFRAGACSDMASLSESDFRVRASEMGSIRG